MANSRTQVGDLHGNVAALRELRDQLIQGERAVATEARAKEHEKRRWTTLRQVSAQIAEACLDRDLGELARAVRTMKMKLRGPGIRKQLARLDEQDDDKKDAQKEKEKAKATVASDKAGEKQKEKDTGKDKKGNPTGACRCAVCGKIIDGSKEPCVDDAKCTNCALKKKVVSKKDQDKKKQKKAVPPSPGMGMGMGGGGGYQEPGGEEGDDKKAKGESRSLRQRNY